MPTSKLISPISPILTAIDGLLFHWDFTGDEPLRSKGRYFAPLFHQEDHVSFSPYGVVSSSSLIVNHSQIVKIRLKECPQAEISGAGRELTVMGWVKVPRAQGSHDKQQVKLDWCFVCKVFNANGPDMVLNFLGDDYQLYSPFHLINAGSSLSDGEIVIDTQGGFQEEIPAPFIMLSGLTLYNRALTRHEIFLIYHHM